MGIAIVTGGGGGNGTAIAQRLYHQGYSVVACGPGGRPQELPADMHWMQADIADPEQASALVAEINALPGDITLLVNNASVQLSKTIVDSNDADWQSVIGVNCQGLFHMCRAVLPLMADMGGSIINIGATCGETAAPAMALYNASMAFMQGVSRSIALDHGPMVRCNVVQPGRQLDDTDFAHIGQTEQGLAQAREDALMRHPAGRFGQPQDVAATVAWLASDEASFITGQVISVDGGVNAASPIRTDLTPFDPA